MSAGAPPKPARRGALRLALLCLGILLLVVATFLRQRTPAHIADASIRQPDGSTHAIQFPYVGDAGRNQVYEFSFTIHDDWLTPRSLVFVPDDRFMSLAVNGQDISLAHFDPQLLEYEHGGFTFGIAQYLRPGTNSVTVRILNRTGPCALDVRPGLLAWPAVAENLSIAGALVLLLGVLVRQLEVPWVFGAPFLLGAALRMGYLVITPYATRAHDVYGHIEYIEYLVTHHALPDPYAGWSFYQPPLYYILAALLRPALLLLRITGRDAFLRALQVQSLVYQLGFVALSMLTARHCLAAVDENRGGLRPAVRARLSALFATLIALWPSAIMHSVRIGNDDLQYLCFGGAFYFISRWWTHARHRDFTAAAFFGAVGMLVKSNSLALFGIFGALCLVRFVLDDNRRVLAYLRWLWPSLALMIASVALTLGPAAMDTLRGRRSNLIVGNVSRLRSDFTVGNGAENYLWFDTKTFVTQPFASTMEEGKNREWFWNFSLKSGLFGEFIFPSPWLSNLAVILSVLFLAMGVCFLAWLAASRREHWIQDLPSLVTIGVLFASLALMRMSIPVACTSDFRYILPVLTPLLCVYVRALSEWYNRAWTRLARTGEVVAWSFGVASLSFFVTMLLVG